MSDGILSKVEQIAQEISEKEGCVLYDVEFKGTGLGRTLRVFIDKESGIGIDDCTNVSRALNLHLDADDIIPGGAYQLEVSSPGLERFLRKNWHYKKALGEKIDFHLTKPMKEFGVEGAQWQLCKHSTGVIVESDEVMVTIELAEKTTLKVPFEFIEKAKILFDFSKPRNKR